ncbi:hypothetical protein SBOR_4783 [Sclerotinia borealis F-4128]|uniref:Uncharacterized protein n=1 Tax=Sclerotinia borealis (strain F-4128) TaxID=1432307 RepID=W9CG04_SCLBF|nr:hypothetical protein SBOR_4783 [Sclerotinia borealis F-4128]
MSSSTISNTPFTPKNKTPTRSPSTSSTNSRSSSISRHIYQFTPKSLTLTRSLSASSSQTSHSHSHLHSQPSSPFLEPPSQYETRHPSELIYRRMPDSPKPHYFYERPDFFIPKRLAPKAPSSPRARVFLIDGVDSGEEDDE